MSNNGQIKKGSEPRNFIANMAGSLHRAFLNRTKWISDLLTSRNRNLNHECGYPETLTLEHFEEAFCRNGIATRAVTIFPEESWKFDPEVYETEDVQQTTPFEVEWATIKDTLFPFHYLERIDILSGIGRYGVMLIGIDDGKMLDEPIDSVVRGEAPGSKIHNITYLRCFTESLAQIAEVEKDQTSPRYGQPTFYNLKFLDNTEGTNSLENATMDVKVHWSRIIHVCDERTTSEVIGTPRLENIFDRLHDLRKLLGGSGEMFWKGGFPGYSIETVPDSSGLPVKMDLESISDEMEKYMSSLQRYIALENANLKPMFPQIADPRGHIEVQFQAISVAKGIPMRVFMGSEQGELASSQDRRNWIERVMRRQNRYVSPCIIRPFVDRLILMGVLPEPSEPYKIEWPDLISPSKDERASIAKKMAEAIATYMGSEAEQIMPPMAFLMYVMGFNQEESEYILEMAESHLDEIIDREEKLSVLNPAQTEPPQAPGGQGGAIDDKKQAEDVQNDKGE